MKSFKNYPNLYLKLFLIGDKRDIKLSTIK